MKNKVNIPEKFFLNEAKNEYYDIHSRLCAEFVQNCHDSGATRIDFTFDEDTITVIDNGKGMSKERMVEALLTLGGSIKEKGDTGGFGAAKKILLFSHEWYEISSLNTHVKGSILDYEFISGDFIQGTRVKIKPFPEFDYRKSSMIYYTEEFLKKCSFDNCQVFINGDLFEGYLSLPMVRETELMSVFAEDSNKTGNCIYVRKNGLFMFHRYVTSLNQSVVCEVKPDSKQAFSQSRDNLKGNCLSEFNSLVDELNVDKMSFKTRGIRKRLFRGLKSFVSFISKMTESTILTKPEQVQLKEVMTKIDFNAIEAKENPEYAFEEIKKHNIVDEPILEKIKEEYHKEEKAKINYDFLVDLCNSEYSEVPEEYHPETIGFENEQIALLWKHCILEIVRICGISLNFTIGFTLSKFNEALCYKENGVQYLLINPEILKNKYETLDERLIKTLLVAIHEIIHVTGKRYHDEEFALNFEEYTTKVILNLDKGKIWSKVEGDKI